MTALSAPISINTQPNQRGQFVDSTSHSTPVKSIGPFITFLQVMISLGLLPLILWPTRWAEFLDHERQDLLDLVTWWRERVMPDDAAQLDNIAARFRPRPILMLLPWLLVGFNVVLIATLITQGDKVDRIWDLTFKHAIDPNALDTVSRRPMVFHVHGRMILSDRPGASLPWEHQLYVVWMGSLLLAYGLHWYSVRSHAVAVHSLTRWTNRLGRQHGFVKVKTNAAKMGLNALWIIMGVVLCSMHAWWAIPMIFAGALQQRYSTVSSPSIRAALAGQAHQAAALGRTVPDRFCRCGGRLPAPAKVCPRCGTAL